MDDILYKSIICASYLDTLGFKGGTWEFNYSNTTINNLNFALQLSYRIINEYYSLGGENINLSKWVASDDTILLMATLKGILDKDYLKALLSYKDIIIDKNSTRAPGVNTKEAFLFYTNKSNHSKLRNYEIKQGGNGSAIRTAPIGIIFDNEKDVIKEAFINSILTHNYTLGFLGGIAMALFANFAKNKIKPELWLKRLLSLEKDIDSFIKKDYPWYKEYKKDKFRFWNKIKDYQEYRLPNLKNSNMQNPIYRVNSFIRMFSNNFDVVTLEDTGGNGIDSILFVYESIMLSTNNDKIDFKQLLFFSTLHFGDNDSTGCMAGALYGIYMNEIPDIIKPVQLEFNNEIKELCNKFKK